jgi:hypothetical protein
MVTFGWVFTDVPNTETSEDVAVARDYHDSLDNFQRYEIINNLSERVAEYRTIVTCP